MDRSYSPVSPYGRAYESHARTYSSKNKSMFSYLTSKKTKNLRLGLGVVAIVFLLLAIFFTVLLRRDFTIDELNGSWNKLAGIITWTKSSNGKIFVAFLWILFILAVVPFGIGTWFRKQTMSIL